VPPLKPYARFGALRKELKNAAAEYIIPCKKSFYRCVTLEWGKPEHLIFGEGSRQRGSRWMAKGVTRVVYLASTEGIALKEARNNFAHYGIQPRQHPRLVVEIAAELETVIDLPKLLETSSWPRLQELLGEDWNAVNGRGQETLSQATGRILYELGFEGVRVPSRVDSRGHNLFLFPENFSTTSTLAIHGEKELKKWLA